MGEDGLLGLRSPEGDLVGISTVVVFSIEPFDILSRRGVEHVDAIGSWRASFLSFYAAHTSGLGAVERVRTFRALMLWSSIRLAHPMQPQHSPFYQAP